MMKGNKEIKLTLIATYPQMSQTFIKMASDEGFKVENIFASFDEAAKIAKKVSKKTDVILSRGGTGDYIKKAVKDTPVIIIPITPFDVIQSMRKLDKHIKEVALFNFKRKIYGIESIEKMFNVKIHEYTFTNATDIKNNVLDVVAKNIRTLIGGAVAVPLARKYGINGIILSAGEETIYRAIYEAKHLIDVRDIERKKNMIYRSIFNSITDGIIYTDNQNNIQLINPIAKRIFNIENNFYVNQNVVTAIPNTQIPRVFKTGIKEISQLQKINNTIISTNRIPLILNGEKIGVVCTFQDITKIQKLEQNIRSKIQAKGFTAKYQFKDIITNNSVMNSLKTMAKFYASTKSAILIEGESGTGKELFAQSIHNASMYKRGPFVAVNCAAIPEDLLESILFGYEGGAFTGAKKNGKSGLFEIAHNGTIFLDEIGELSKPLQARLLRVLQEKEIMRVGGDRIIPIDVRIISATNQNIQKKILESKFRNDLYYRLCTFNIKIPPLRERRDDIILLLEQFLRRKDVQLDESLKSKIYPLLKSYDWPGNVRELYNVAERLELAEKNQEFHAVINENIDFILNDAVRTTKYDMVVTLDTSGGLKNALNNAEREIIKKLMIRHNNNQQKVAQYLQISNTSLWRKMRE